MLRLFFRFFGFLFSWAAIGSIMALAGLAAIFTIYGKDLPDYAQLETYEPPTLSRIYSGQGALMDEFARERRIFTPIDEIPDQVKDAFISAEDKNFYAHHGFDPRGIVAAVYDAAVNGERLRGASTITQQVMKNFLLTGDRSGERKIKEIILATRLESTLSKDEILELYLNEIFLGQNSYGVTAAAQIYFAKSLEELTLAETAYLAALPQAPSVLHPVREKDRAIGRRNYVLDQMALNGYIARDAAEAAKAEDLLTVQSGAIASARSDMPPRDYFTDEIRRQLSAKLGDEELFTGGLIIRATVNPEYQAVAAQALRDGLERYDRGLRVNRGPVAQVDPAGFDAADEASWRRALSAAAVPRDIDGWHPALILSIGEASARIGIEGVPEDEDGHFLSYEEASWGRVRDENGRLRASEGPDDLWDVGDVVFVKAAEDGTWSYRQIPAIQGGFMAMDTQTGRVLAMQGGFSYQSSVFNRATQALRQPGSSFKPFVYAAALDNGYSPGTIVLDAPIQVATAAGIWAPENSGGTYYGPAPIRTGLEQSRNLMTVRIAQDIGMDTVARYGEGLGIYDDMPRLLSYSLGAGETTLYKMVTAYAEIANGGLKVEPTLVDRVQDRYGKTIYRHDQRPCEGCAADDLAESGLPFIHSDGERVMDAITAYQVTSMLQGAVSRGTSAALGRPAAAEPRRQDRHDQRGQGRLVHRLQPAHRRRLLHGLRRPAAARRERLRRHALRADLRRVHQDGDGGAGAGDLAGAAGRHLRQDRPAHRPAPARLCRGVERPVRVHPRRPGDGGRRLRPDGRRRLEDGRRRAALRQRAELAADRARAGARPDPGAAVEPVARLDVERRALLTPGAGWPPRTGRP